MADELKDIVTALSRRTGFVTSDELSLATGITPRRVRSVLSQAAPELERFDVNVEATPRKGYRLLGAPDAVKRLLNSDDAESSRLQEVLEILLMADGYVKLDELCELLYVSRSTMNRLMRDARTVLAQHGLGLAVKPYHGLRVEGSEYNRRLCAAECCGQRAHRDSGIPALLLKRPEDAKRARSIEGVLRESLSGRGIDLGDFAFYNLVVHLYIALLRVEHGEYVSVPTEVRATPKERQVAEAIADGLARRFGVELPPSEISYIVIHLQGKRVLGSSDSTMITSEIEDLVHRMNERVCAQLGIDVREDLELFVSLGLHLIPCLARVRYGLRVANPLLDEIKTNMRVGFECALAASSVVEEHCGASLAEDEVGYFAMHYALACERRGEGDSLRVLLCCATGAGTARYLKQKIVRQYGVEASQVETASVHDLPYLDLSVYGVMLSTVPVPREFADRVIYLEDIFADSLPEPSAPEIAAKGAKRVLASEHVLMRDRATREEAIAALCAEVRDPAIEAEALEASVLARERASSTALGNMVALPHPERLLADGNHVRAMVLRHPIDWDGKPVRIVLLVALSRHDRQAGEAINDALLDFAMDADRVLAFLKRPSAQGLAEII